MRIIALLLCSTIALGCGQVVSQVEKFAGDDLARTSELAAKYNRPQVKRCSDFMLAQVQKLQAADENLVGLQAEPTSGLFSTALKAALIADALRSLQEVNGPQFKSDFKAACSEVAGDVLFNIMQDAAKFRGR